MATLDNVDLLARLRFQVKRPTADESLTDVQAYQLLSDAQRILFDDVVSRAPNAFLTAPTLMTTSDGGKTYVFGTDSNGYPQLPQGRVQLFWQLSDVPSNPLVEGWDYLNEGSTVRRPNNQTFPSAPYYRGVPQPADISAAVQPTAPVEARMLLVWKAAELYAGLGSLRDSSSYQALYEQGVTRLLLRLKTQFGASGFGGLSGLQSAMLGS